MLFPRPLILVQLFKHVPYIDKKYYCIKCNSSDLSFQNGSNTNLVNTMQETCLSACISRISVSNFCSPDYKHILNILSMLLKYGCDVNKQIVHDGETLSLVELAVRKGSPSAVKMLWVAGSNPGCAATWWQPL